MAFFNIAPVGVFGANIGRPIGDVRALSAEDLRGHMDYCDDLMEVVTGKQERRVIRVLDRLIEEYQRRLNSGEATPLFTVVNGRSTTRP